MSKCKVCRLWPWLGMFFFGLVCGAAGSLPAFATELFLDRRVSTPLGMGVAAVFAALGAGWIGNIAYTGSRTRWMPVVGLSVVMAAVVTAIWGALLAVGVNVEVLPFFLLLLMVAPVAACSSECSRRFREHGAKKWKDVITTVATVMVTVAVVFLTALFASLLGALSN